MCSTMRLIFNLYSTFNALFNLHIALVYLLSTLIADEIFNSLYYYIYIYIYYRYNIKHLYNVQIQKYIANKKIIQNYAQMKYKWPVTTIKPLKNKLFGVTSMASQM